MRASILFLLSFACQILVYYIPSTTIALSLSSNTDKLALLALKKKLTNDVSESLPSWNESLHFCEWQGVTCGHRHMGVSVLHLKNQTLGGTLGPSLGNLTFLRVLTLSNVDLHGEIPKQIGRLKRLQVLDLKKNNLQGEIPIELTNCSNIKEIDMWDNQLTGKVPSWFESMMQLTKLLLDGNKLVDTIPPSLGNISSLQYITLAYNNLEGNIPYSLGRLSSLKFLSLDSCHLSGEIPSSLYNLSNIQVFDLGVNKLFGSLPSNMNLCFPNLQELWIGDNQITGSFPSSISNLTELKKFDISCNAFTGSIPRTLGHLNKLEWFGIASNNFGNLGARDLDFLSSLTNCTQLSALFFFENKFGGELPDHIGNFSNRLMYLDIETNQIHGAIPERIGQLTGLKYLNLGNNSIEGTIPNSIGQLIGLTNLNLGNNSLEGTIPDSIGKLKNLVSLILKVNKLNGKIPTTIGNLTFLSELDLSINEFEGSIPYTLKYCTKLQMLNIGDNKLSGDISNQIISSLVGLIYLHLYKNSLTGPIPSMFGNLKHLSILNLHSNNLSGEIPNDLATCLTLTKVVLRRNFFHGIIPSFLGSLRSLEILDISKNNFSSTIPFELENLTLLNSLDMSFNNLYGEVPIGGVFSNVTAISLIKNKNLCGGIPQLKLPACSVVHSKKQKRTLKRKLILIIVIGVIFIFFIVAIITICYLKKNTKKLSASSTSLQNGPLRVTYGELHEATNGFSSSDLVGTGSYGHVYKGSLHYFERPIAVKVLNLETRGATKSFTAECKALGKMKHRNIVRILTCCSSVDYKGEDFKAIVFEFMPNGSLEKMLHDYEGFGNHYLSLAERIDISLDVAYALDYLHNGADQVVVHCDIKPNNVLLDNDMVAHLGDFGLARLIHGATRHSIKDQVDSSTIKGTIGYIPPEYGAGGPISSQGDIYSYGILLLELLTGKRSTDSMFSENLSIHEFCKMKISEGIFEIADQRLLMPFSEDQTGIVENKIRKYLVMFAGIGVACSEEFPAHRMLIKDVIVKLNEIKSKFP